MSHAAERVRALLAEADASEGPYVEQNVASLRRRLARLESEATALPATVTTVPSVATARPIHKPTPKPRSREEAIRFMAANAPIALPDGMATQAIASGHKVDAFAIAVADHVLAARAEQAREVEIERLVAQILSA